MERTVILSAEARDQPSNPVGMSGVQLASFLPTNEGQLVWQDVCDLLSHPALIEEALRRAQGGAWLPQELQARRENLHKAARSLEQQLERLTEAYLAGVLELEEYRRRKQDLAHRAEAVASQERQLEAGVNRQKELTGMVESIQDLCHRIHQGLENASFEQKRQVVELLIDRVVVTNGDVEIRYVIPTSPKGEQVCFGHLRTDYFSCVQRQLCPSIMLQRKPVYTGKMGELRPGKMTRKTLTTTLT